MVQLLRTKLTAADHSPRGQGFFDVTMTTTVNKMLCGEQEMDIIIHDQVSAGSENQQAMTTVME